MVLTLEISTFIEDMKVLLDLGCDVQFRLAQDTSGRKYFDVSGISPEKNTTRTQIVIESFEKDGPDVIPQHEVEFHIDPTTCSFVFGKFNKRINFLGDEIAEIKFMAASKSQSDRDLEN